MSIAHSSTDISKIYLGSTEVTKMYLGDTLVYGGETPSVPYDEQLEYLQGNGYEYIEMTLSVASGTYFETVFTIIPMYCSTNKDDFFSATPYEQYRGHFYSLGTDRITYSSLIGESYTSGGFGAAIGEQSTITLSTDGTIGATGTEVENSRPLTAALEGFRIFGGYQNDYRYPIKICAFKITAGSTVLYDFIPVLKDEVGYMYDRIGGSLYSNAGSGEFTCGVQLPSSYASVDYISSGGSNYVNTGIIQTSRYFMLEMKFKWTGSTSSDFEVFFGYLETGNTPRCSFSKYNGKWMFGTNATKVTSVAVDNDVHTVRIVGNASTNRDYLYLDGTQITYASTSSTGIAANTLPFYAFGRNDSSSLGRAASADIYYIRYYVFSGSTYRVVTSSYDFRPCTYNGTSGFYDVANSEFHPLV